MTNAAWIDTLANHHHVRESMWTLSHLIFAM